MEKCNLKTLIADDDPIVLRLLQAKLTSWGYEVIVATNGIEALEAIQCENPPEIAILDWMMPGMDGSQLCETIREQQGAKYIYTMLVSARVRRTDVVRGLQSGADDYLTKPFHPLELKSRLIAGQRIIELQEKLIAAREQFRVQAVSDSLTGAWNKRGIMDIFQQELNRSRREAKPLSVILADIDHFKSINDTFGHIHGDEVLREVVLRMKADIRSYDHVGRYGGEEFLLILPDCDEDGVVAIGERIRQQIAAEPVRYAGATIPVTISLGAFVSNPPHSLESHVILKVADDALYCAKRGGRNRLNLTAQSDSITA